MQSTMLPTFQPSPPPAFPMVCPFSPTREWPDWRFSFRNNLIILDRPKKHEGLLFPFVVKTGTLAVGEVVPSLNTQTRKDGRTLPGLLSQSALVTNSSQSDWKQQFHSQTLLRLRQMAAGTHTASRCRVTACCLHVANTALCRQAMAPPLLPPHCFFSILEVRWSWRRERHNPTR